MKYITKNDQDVARQWIHFLRQFLEEPVKQQETGNLHESFSKLNLGRKPDEDLERWKVFDRITLNDDVNLELRKVLDNLGVSKISVSRSLGVVVLLGSQDDLRFRNGLREELKRNPNLASFDELAGVIQYYEGIDSSVLVNEATSAGSHPG